MMRMLLVSLTLCCGLSMATINRSMSSWFVTGSDSNHYVVSGSGNPVDKNGATVSLRAQQADPEKSGGSFITLDATPYRGHTITLTADLDTHDAAKGAGIWLRADSQNQPSIAFMNSGRELVLSTTSAAHREVGFVVPTAARSLVMGTILMGSGDVVAHHLRLSIGADSQVSATAELDAAIGIVRAHALRAREVDWTTVEPRVRAMAKDAKILSDVYPAIRFLLKSLGDHHSFFLEPIASHQELTGGVASSPSSVAMKPGGIGYIDMPGYRGMEASAIHAFANDMVNSIGHIATQARCGWVVDLRNDTGGNMMPMLEGLRPLLGDRPLGSFRNADGHLSPFSAINRLDKMQFKGPALEHATVAVLLGPRTGSSGEVVAVSFVGRPYTRSFGQPTAGLSSANTGFPLPDHSMIFLTTAIDVDRTGHAYGDTVQPDQIIAAPTTSATDPTLDAAQAWLASSCAH